MPNELTIEAALENVDRVVDFVNEHLEQHGCPLRTQTQIDIAIDELFGNIAHYAYAPETGTATVQVNVAEDSASVVLTFIDEGMPFDPLKTADPDTTLGIDERQMGGLGIFLVKKTMDDMTYRHDDGKNILTITKQF